MTPKVSVLRSGRVNKPKPTRRAVLAGLAAAPLVPAPFVQSAASAQPLHHLDLLIDRVPVPTYAGFFMARERGAFEHRGLNVHIVEGRSAGVTAEMVGANREYWIAASSAAATAIGRSRGLPVRSLAVYYRREPTVIYAHAEDHIDVPRDLYGKRIGLVPGSIRAEEFRALLAANRLVRSKINEIAVDAGPQALLDRKVDALIDYEEMVPAELQAQGRKISTMRFADYGVRTYSLNLIVNELAWLDPARQEIARKVADAVAEGYQFVHDSPAEAAALFARLYPALPRRYVDLSMQIVGRQLAVPIGSQTRPGWEDTLKILSSLGLLARAVGAEEVAIYD